MEGIPKYHPEIEGISKSKNDIHIEGMSKQKFKVDKRNLVKINPP
jgi:hypothetical protein